MSAPKANLSASLKKKADQPASPGGVAATFRQAEVEGPTKKATYELPLDLHKALRLHAATSDETMRDLVVRYIHAGLEADGLSL